MSSGSDPLCSISRGTKPVLLVVDDEPMAYRLLSMQLQGEGYSLIAASSGEEALEACKRSKPDLILLDLLLPGIDGTVLAKQLKQDPETATIPIIMITASEEQAIRVAALQAGVEDFLTKPVGRAELIARVRNMMRLKGYQDDLRRHNEWLEREVAERTEILLQKKEKIERLTRVYAVLSEINSAIVRIHDRQRLLDEACRIAVSHGAFKSVWIGIIDPVTQNGKVVAAAGSGNDYFDKVLLTSAPNRPYSDRPACIAVREGRALVCQDIRQMPSMAGVCDELVARDHFSLAVFPLNVDGCAIGVLNLYAGEVDFFDGPELKLLNELANDIAFGLQYIEKEERLHHLTFYDALTGLPNRALFMEHLARSIKRVSESRGQLVVTVGDIARFRLINEMFGRNVGDRVLEGAAGRLLTLVRNPESLARIGSASFASILEGMEDLTAVAHQVEYVMREASRKPVIVNGEELNIPLRAGVAVYPDDGVTAEELCRHAETAMMQAKVSGDLFRFYESSVHERVAMNLRMETQLRRAIEHGEFVLHYQPKVDSHTLAPVGLEALIRWDNPEVGMVPPVRFISILEETGLIVQVGEWAIRQALADYRRMCERGLHPLRIAVNVSICQLRHGGFSEMVADAIAASGVPATALELEVTESLLMNDIDSTIEVLQAVRKMGVSIAIDDFGTGYSSLSYLAKLPLDTLKIDRSFIADMSNSAESMTIVSSVISLAHSLHLNVVAEGVEHEGQEKSLRMLECDAMQGYRFSRPLPFDWLNAYLCERTTFIHVKV